MSYNYRRKLVIKGGLWMKHEWRKHEKELYMAKRKPQLVEVPQQKFLMVRGQGNPNGAEFKQRIEPLYALSYAIRMMPKQGHTPDGYFEYTVYPLEGVWDLTEKGRQLDHLDKDELVYTLMIRQPEFVTQAVFERAFETTQHKKPHPLLNDVTFETVEEGLCVQMLHVGNYDAEPETFAIMEEFTKESQLQRDSMLHREIYLSDARRVAPERLKTVLRYRVSE